MWLCSCNEDGERDRKYSARLVEAVKDCREREEGAKSKSKPDGSALTNLSLLFIKWLRLCGSVNQTFMNHTDEIMWFTKL